MTWFHIFRQQLFFEKLQEIQKWISIFKPSETTIFKSQSP